MKKLICVLQIIYLIKLSSCYPTYVASSGEILDKGKSSLNFNAFSPIVNPGFAIRYGIGNNNEIHLQSTILSHELGFRRAVFKNNSLFRSSLGITLGKGNISYGTGDFNDEPSFWDPSDTTSQEVVSDISVSLIRAPFIFSFSESENKFILFGHVAPTIALKDFNKEFGISMCVGANIKIKNRIGLCISPFLHFPLSGYPTDNDLFLGFERVNPLQLYNFGIMVGVQIGQF